MADQGNTTTDEQHPHPPHSKLIFRLRIKNKHLVSMNMSSVAVPPTTIGGAVDNN